MNKARWFLFAFLIVTPLFAEPGHLELTEEEKKAVQNIRDKKHADDAEKKRLVIPPGLDTTEIDLMCRKHNILSGLKSVAYRADGVLEEIVAAKGKQDEAAENAIKLLCLKASKVGDEAFSIMGNLHEKKLDNARDLQGGSKLYKAAFLDNRAIEEICEKVMTSGRGFTQRDDFETSRSALEKAVEELGKKARSKFAQAAGENSHKK